VWEDGAGLICCTWPKGGKPDTVILYAEEVWTGIEYEVAALMIEEGLIREALAIIRTVHDRYTTGPRSPWNEIECGDHYARAMSSWSVLLAAQGFHYHGPKSILGFAPRLQQDDFKSFFSTAEGWGSFSQRREGKTQTNLIELKYGDLKLRQLELGIPSARLTEVKLELNGEILPFKHEIMGDRLIMNFPGPLNLKKNDSLKAVITQ
jgi:non-lysosomal glucosylceramidase